MTFPKMYLSKFSVCFAKSSLNFFKRSLFKHAYNTPAKRMTVTIIGGGTPIGRIVALLLKQNPHINELRLFDNDEKCCATALDLAHIDTNTVIRAYPGIEMLKYCIMDSQVVIVCCGTQRTPSETQRTLFEKNAGEVRNIAIHMAEFNPRAVFCVATPPVMSMVPLMSEEYKKAMVYDPRKIIGITTLAAIRINTLVGRKLAIDPTQVVCPIVGGCCRTSAVPVLSRAAPCPISTGLADELRKTMVAAEDEILNCQEQARELVVSPAFAISRFTHSLVKALKGDSKCVECAYVRQVGHIKEYLKYMTSIVKLGCDGVESTHMPEMSDEECKHLEEAAEYIRSFIHLGESYVTGAFPKIRRKRKKCKQKCELVKKVDKERNKTQEKSKETNVHKSKNVKQLKKQ